jgi:acetyl-CoA synthetase
MFSMSRRRPLVVHRRPGWVTGHSYLVYGPMLNGATSFMFEGGPAYPVPEPLVAVHRTLRHHDLLHRAHRHPRTDALRRGVAQQARSFSCVCSARSASRSTPKRGSGITASSARSKLPIMDTWWQTETGHVHDHADAGRAAQARFRHASVLRSGSRDRGRARQPVADDTEGYLVLKNPWPAMLRTIYGDDERYVKQYWSKYPGKYTTGDSARRDRTATTGSSAAWTM